MFRIVRLMGLSVILNALVVAPTVALDGAVVELGVSADGTERAGIALRWDWGRYWSLEGEWYLGGYWEVSSSYWTGHTGTTGNDGLLEAGLTPILRLWSGGAQKRLAPYIELGLGPHLLSDTHIDDKKMSTALQLGSVLGLALPLGAGGHFELGYRFQHLSNGGLERPNPGINFHLVRLAYSY